MVALRGRLFGVTLYVCGLERCGLEAAWDLVFHSDVSEFAPQYKYQY